MGQTGIHKQNGTMDQYGPDMNSTKKRYLYNGPDGNSQNSLLALGHTGTPKKITGIMGQTGIPKHTFACIIGHTGTPQNFTCAMGQTGIPKNNFTCIKGQMGITNKNISCTMGQTGVLKQIILPAQRTRQEFKIKTRIMGQTGITKSNLPA